MTTKPATTEIELIEGKNAILLIAPHGVKGNDDNTDKLTRKMAERLNCYAVINGIYKRPDDVKDPKKKTKSKGPADPKNNRYDLNDLQQVRKYLNDKFLQPIITFKNEIESNGDSPLVVLIHGIDDVKINKHYGKDTDIVIGIGLGHGDPDSLSCDRKLSDKLQELLEKSKPKAITSVYSDKCLLKEPTTNYAGFDENNLNQLFKHQNSLDNDTAVQSIQLEIRKAGYRSTNKELESSAEQLSVAIGKLKDVKLAEPKVTTKSKPSKVIREVQANTTLVEEAFSELKSIFTTHINDAMLKAGRYIIENFYDDNIELARKGRPTKGKSLNKLAEMLHGREEGNPSRTWIYNAVKMVIAEEDYKSIPTYVQLQLSHKIALLPMKDREKKDREKKELLIEEVKEKAYTVRQITEKVKEAKIVKKRGLDLKRVIKNPAILFGKEYTALVTADYLGKLKGDKAKTLLKESQAKIKALEEEMKKSGDYIKRYKELIAGLGKDGK